MKRILTSTSARITIGVIAVMAIFVAIAYYTSSPLIAQEDARTIALAEAGVTEDEVVSIEVVTTDEYYRVSFATDERNYSFDITKDDGDVVRASFEISDETTLVSEETIEEEISDTTSGSDTTISSSGTTDDSSSGSTSSSTTTGSSSSSSTTSSSTTTGDSSSSSTTSSNGTGSGSTSSNSSGSTSSNSTNSTSSAITEDGAKAIALADAGVSESAVSYIKVKRDHDHGQTIYEVEFYANGTKYEYEISGSDGSIISMEYDVKNISSLSSSTGDMISLQEASEIALGRVAGATSSNLHIELDHDDGRLVYEGDIIYGGMEYEFTIDAYSGSVIEWSMESWH